MKLLTLKTGRRQRATADPADHSGKNGASTVMSAKPPRFAVGDTVCERFPFASAKPEPGKVIESYDFENEYRYVVKFESGREEVLYEKELVSAQQ